MKPPNKEAASGRPHGAATMPTLTVIILTFDEEKHVQRAIASVAAIASDILVVDSFSKDRTTNWRAAPARGYFKIRSSINPSSFNGRWTTAQSSRNGLCGWMPTR